MKRVLSLITIVCLLMSCIAVPASATGTDPVVTIDGITDGGVYSAGQNITIIVDTNMADVKNIDIYANDDKLPGTVIGGSGIYTWYAPSSGKYIVKAVVTTVDGNQDVESEEINITIQGTNTPTHVLSSLNEVTDVSGWKNTNNVAYSESYASSEYLRFGDVSLEVLGSEETTCDTKLTIDNYNAPGSGYIMVPFYLESSADVEQFNFATLSQRLLGSSSAVYLTGGDVAEKGWNVATLGKIAMGTTLTQAQVRFSNGYGNYTVVSPAVLAKTNIYYGGAWFVQTGASDNTSITLSVEKTSFADGATGVCYNPGNYRITFDEEIIANVGAVTMSKLADDGETYEAVEGYSVNIGNDYIDIIIPDNTLETNATYKVTVGNDNVWDNIGLKFAGAEYTFSTVNTQCDNLEPVLDFVYPADGAAVGTSATVAAKVIFTSNVTDVTFTAGEGDAVEATEYSNGEYALNLTGLVAGTPVTVTATANLSEGDPITKSITITPAANETYALWGLDDGDYIFSEKDGYRKISVINGEVTYLPGLQQPTSAFKSNFSAKVPTDLVYVDFYLDGEFEHRATATDSYSWNMPLNMLGSHKLTVKALSNNGTLTKYEKSFDMVAGALLKKHENDYTDGVVPAWNNAEGSDENVLVDSVTQPDGTTGNALHMQFKEVATSSNRDADIVRFDSLGDGKGIFIRTEFDVMFKANSFWNLVNAGNIRALQTGNSNNGGAWPTTTWKHIEIDYYPEKGLCVTYVDGLEYRRTSNGATNGVTNGELAIAYATATATAGTLNACYIDNLKSCVYSVEEGLAVSREGSTVTAYNNTNSPQSFVVILASYTVGEDGKKRMTEATPIYITVDPYDIFEYTYTVPAKSSLFVWSSLDDCAPLTDALIN